MGMEKSVDLKKAKAVLVVSGDDKPSQKLMKELEKSPFKVVFASYHSQLTALADVVLPVGMWAEESGHFLSMDGHVQEAVATLTMSEEVKSSSDAVKALAEQVGMKVSGDSWKKEIKTVSAITEIVGA